MRFPLTISLLGMFSGVLIAILFGINEDIFKDKISRDLKHHPKYESFTSVEAQAQFVKKEEEKNWRYYQRFHFHSTGISAMALAALLLLIRIPAPRLMKSTTAWCISVGGFLYPFVWLFAAMYGPLMGRSEAKEAFAVFGYMGGVFLIGIVLEIFLLLRAPRESFA